MFLWKTVENSKFCNLNKNNKRNREQSQTTKKVKWNTREIQLPSQNSSMYSAMHYYIKRLLLKIAYEVNT